MGHWLRFCTPPLQQGTGSIPGGGTKIPHAKNKIKIFFKKREILTSKSHPCPKLKQGQPSLIREENEIGNYKFIEDTTSLPHFKITEL